MRYINVIPRDIITLTEIPDFTRILSIFPDPPVQTGTDDTCAGADGCGIGADGAKADTSGTATAGKR